MLCSRNHCSYILHVIIFAYKSKISRQRPFSKNSLLATKYISTNYNINGRDDGNGLFMNEGTNNPKKYCDLS